MKKCSGCHKEIDKYSIACQYCGKLTEEKGKDSADKSPDTKNKERNSEEEKS